MPTFVRTDRCDGCRGREPVVCEYICPGDLMVLDRDGAADGHAMMAYNQEPEQCWECYACVKACPLQAIQIRHYADLVPLGARVQPQCTADAITWSIGLRNGTTKELRYSTRTAVPGAPDGSPDPYGGKPAADLANIGKPGFFTTGPDALHPADPDQLIRT